MTAERGEFTMSECGVMNFFAFFESKSRLRARWSPVDSRNLGDDDGGKEGLWKKLFEGCFGKISLVHEGFW